MDSDRDLLRRLASKYIWWEAPDEAVTRPARVIAQVMNLGTQEDTQFLADQVGDEALREVLTHAEAGWFDEQSWARWHLRLGLATEVDQVPPLPVRIFGD